MERELFWMQLLQLILLLWIANHINLFQSLTIVDRVIGIIIAVNLLYYAGNEAWKKLVQDVWKKYA